MNPARVTQLVPGMRAQKWSERANARSGGLFRTTSTLFLAVVVALSLAACPSENQNPERLWLSLDGVETRVRLIPAEPEPF